MNHNRYGCKPPKEDVRDYRLSKSISSVKLPEEFTWVDLPKIKNQGSVSSCVAHSTSSILEHRIKNKYTLSTNFIYGIQNKECGHDGYGMYLRDACKIVSTYGDMLEEHCSGNTEVPQCWKIAEEAFNNEEYLQIASKFKVESYFSCKGTEDIKRAVYNYGPVLCSIKWYDTFKCDKDGILSGQFKGDYGYHAVIIYGWNDVGFLCQNSWGKYWGEQGRFILPYNIPVAEAKGFVMNYDPDIYIPKRNKFLDFIYKIINFILNIFKK